MMTNIRGTAAPSSGQIDRFKQILDDTLGDLEDMALDCWWRNTLDRHLDNAHELQWAFPQVLSGPQALRILLEDVADVRAKARTETFLAYVAMQHADDLKLRFKQVELDTIEMIKLFVDVPAAPTFPSYVESSPSWREMISSSGLVERRVRVNWSDRDAVRSELGRIEAVPAARLILGPKAFNRILINGAPGQGKSTLLQYSCQLLRARLLDESIDEAFGSNAQVTSQRLPIKLELKEFIGWRQRSNGERGGSLEGMIADEISNLSGGADFTVTDLHGLLKSAPGFIALDGLDEVPDPTDRATVVEEIEAMSTRLARISPRTMIVVTSRPVDQRARSLSQKDFMHLTLQDIPQPLAEAYLEKWLAAQNLPAENADIVRRTWAQRRQDPHVQDLTRNVMQLSILLHLINSRGSSLPDRRTLLYDDYVRTLLDREAEKDARVAMYRDVLLDLHGYIAVHLHGEAERNHGNGLISEVHLNVLISEFQTLRGGGVSQGVEDLFAGVQRVVALVSRKEGYFEFEIQPLREYFAGRFLYNSAPYVLPGIVKAGQKHERLFALLQRPYWSNVLRFFAGCFTFGELDGLTQMISNSSSYIDISTAMTSRRLMATLLADRVFAENPLAEQASLRYALDVSGLRQLSASNVNFSLPATESVREFLAKIVEDVKAGDYMGARAYALRAIAPRELLVDESLRLLRGDLTDKDLNFFGFLRVAELLPRDEVREIIRVANGLQRLKVLQVLGQGNAEFDLAESVQDFSMCILNCLRDPKTSMIVDRRVLANNPITSSLQQLESYWHYLVYRSRRYSVSGGFGRWSTVRDKSPEEPQVVGSYSLDPAVMRMPLDLICELQSRTGDNWLTRRMAIAYAARGSRRLAGQASLFEQGDSLLIGVDLVALADFLRRDQATTHWWVDQYDAVIDSEEIERATWLLAVAVMCGPAQLVSLAKEFERAASTLPADWMRSIAATVDDLASEYGPGMLDQKFLMRKLFSDSPTMLLTVLPRFGQRPNWLFESAVSAVQALPEHQHLRDRIAGAKLRLVVSRARNEASKAELRSRLIDVAQCGLETPLVGGDLVQDGSGLIMPNEIAAEIIRTSDNWPASVVRIADLALRFDRSVRPLLDIIHGEEWFRMS